MTATPLPLERPLLKARGLTKHYDANVVLDDVSFEIGRHRVVSLVGENGAGKSTLLNILSGIVQPDAGEMELAGARFRPHGYADASRLGITRVFQEQALIPNIPVYENLLLGHEARFTRVGQWLDRAAMIDAAGRIARAAGLMLDVRRPTGAFSFSQRQALEIARACLTGLEVLGVQEPVVLLDEPTSALDQEDEHRFFALVERMRQVGSLVFVSHRLSEVLALSDDIYVLKDGRIVAHLAASDATESLLHELMVGRERVADYYCENRQRVPTAEAAPVLSVRGLSQPGEYEDITFAVRPGEVVGIGGLLDSGKSALGRGIAGVDPPAAGSVGLGHYPPGPPRIVQAVAHGLGYVPAERLTEGLIAEQPVAWNISLASGRDLFTTALGVWRPRREAEVAWCFIRKLSIRSGAPKRPARTLSGGNQQKVVLARWLAREPAVLVLDNPTRGVDAGAKEELYALIRGLTDRGVGIVLITDELLELIGLSDRILVMQRGRVVAEMSAPPAAKPGEREIVALMLPGEAAAAATDDPAIRHCPLQMEHA